jgi:hypothetical protein
MFANARTHKGSLYRRIAIAGFSVLVVIGGLFALLASHWPFTRSAVITTLQDRFSSTVEFRKFRGTYLTPGCIVEGITFHLNNDRSGPPLATAEKLTIQGGYIGLFTRPRRIGRVKVEGLRVLVPSRNERKDETQGTSHPTESTLIIGEIIADGAVVQFASDTNPTEPLQFDIRQLRLDAVADDRPMSFHAALLIPEPPGEVRADGQFGPMEPVDFGHIALSGSYGFQHANLGIFPGIAGTLSSDGKFNGVLEHVDVEGAIDVPDFQVTRSGHLVHMNVQYRAAVNGTDGDVALQLVDARFEKTSVVSQGEVAGKPGVKGKTVSIDITETSGRIEDWLQLFAKSNRPALTGPMTFVAKAVVPPEQRQFIDEVTLQGDFGIETMRFTRSATQEDVNSLSEHAQGEKEVEDPENVVANLKGHVVLKDGIATFSTLSFSVPGALAQMHGTYGLLNEQIDLHGTLQVDTKLSKGSTGIKSFLLKVVEPFLKKKDAGEVVPIKLTGSYRHPSYGIDYLRVH